MDCLDSKKYAFSQHRECEFFPCHEGIDPDEFNCLFCWCPLFTLGKDCGGNFKQTDCCVKDCSDCLLPHIKESYDYMCAKFPALAELAGRNMDEQTD